MDNEKHGINIDEFKFRRDELDKIGKSLFGTNWPVVYVLNNEEEAYVGETLDAKNRMHQHLDNPARGDLKEVHVISDDDFNKSVILDLEAFLIQHMSSDEKFTLQNGNAGVSNHNYYHKEQYEEKFKDVWRKLMGEKLVIHSLEEIENSDLFKYSPYKALTGDQKDALISILKLLKKHREDPNAASTFFVEGGAGTGKTILAVYLLKLLSEVGQYHNEEEESEFTTEVGGLLNSLKFKKVGFVVPMQSLRDTILKVFGTVKGLDQTMVISPLQVPDDHYDLLVVDEAHRLRKRKALNRYPPFDKNNTKLGFGKEGTELDWVIKCSDAQIFFYDSMQSVKPSDIDKEAFSRLKNQRGCVDMFLTSQLRCLGGQDYLDYIKSIMSDEPPAERRQFESYDFMLFDDVKEMTDAIIKKDGEIGLCRNVAGYAWNWLTKKNPEPGKHDIEIDGHYYDWNGTEKDWINSKNSINEIGCIHTVQGYDLNYAGVIFGNEISYDPIAKKITVDKAKYCDPKGRESAEGEKLKKYIENIYVTLMSRGIKGTYVYVCDDDLREYFRKYVVTAGRDVI